MQQGISPARRSGRMVAAALVLLIGAAPAAFAQAPATPPAKPADKKPAAKPAAPKPKQAQQPAAAPAPAPAPEQAANGAQQPGLRYTPWVKICQNNPQTNNKQVCIVGTDARIESGQPVVAVQIVEPDGADKTFHLVFPIPVRVQYGTRVLVDDAQLGTAPYLVCGGVCVSEYKADADLIGKLKKGKSLTVQAYNGANQLVSLPVPLTDFGKVYDGPPTDLKAIEEQQSKLQEELQKKADEARKKLEAQQPAAAAPAAPPKQ